MEETGVARTSQKICIHHSSASPVKCVACQRSLALCAGTLGWFVGVFFNRKEGVDPRCPVRIPVVVFAASFMPPWPVTGRLSPAIPTDRRQCAAGSKANFVSLTSSPISAANSPPMVASGWTLNSAAIS
jgi:hypothetical protein